MRAPVTSSLLQTLMQTLTRDTVAIENYDQMKK